MAGLRALGGLIMLAFYAAAGLAFHLIAYGEVDWSGAFVYVTMAFWPILLAWEVFKILLLLAIVVLAGLGLYLLIREALQWLSRRT